MRIKNNVYLRRFSRLVTPENAIKLRMWQIRGGTPDKMLIMIPEKKILYTVIPKAANSTVKSCLWKACGADLDVNDIHSVRQLESGPAAKISEYSNQELLNIFRSKEWYKFSFVRNPYNRLLSAYKDKILGMGRKDKKANFLKKINWKKNQLPSFEEFVDKICQQDCDAMDWHWMPQTRLLMGECIDYEFIGRVESFNNDIGRVLSHINIMPDRVEKIISKPVNKTRKKSDMIIVPPSVANQIYEKYTDDFVKFEYDRESYKCS